MGKTITCKNIHLLCLVGHHHTILVRHKMVYSLNSNLVIWMKTLKCTYFSFINPIVHELFLIKQLAPLAKINIQLFITAFLQN